ncbi:collagen alpha-1(XX) chain-like isoform X8 [Sceloporus undulatus]|uniref:collagen alpha-1(XX) chain-like isoform X8 n=1 Tax=Sceloporus undulatus TaxID=8520 RepID=UPI001C4BE959|nr:collagen alpha-1(XX) chain-like isoform X8 [Sceloporus undulatus]
MELVVRSIKIGGSSWNAWPSGCCPGCCSVAKRLDAAKRVPEHPPLPPLPSPDRPGGGRGLQPDELRPRAPLPQPLRLHLLGEGALVAAAAAAAEAPGAAGPLRLPGQEGLGVPLALAYLYGAVLLAPLEKERDEGQEHQEEEEGLLAELAPKERPAGAPGPRHRRLQH